MAYPLSGVSSPPSSQIEI
ncbi:hypothetical protein LINPERHAP2_LOCUS33608 [Linum perenne]